MSTIATRAIPALALAACALAAANPAAAVSLTGGNAVISIDEAAFNANSKIDHLDAWFDNSETRTQLLTLPAPGDGFTLPNINFGVNVGALADPDGPGGRTRLHEGAIMPAGEGAVSRPAPRGGRVCAQARCWRARYSSPCISMRRLAVRSNSKRSRSPRYSPGGGAAAESTSFTPRS